MEASVRVAMLIGLVASVTLAAAPSGSWGSRWADLPIECERGVADDAGRSYRFPDHAGVVETFSGTRALPAGGDGAADERVPCVELK